MSDPDVVKLTMRYNEDEDGNLYANIEDIILFCQKLAIGTDEDLDLLFKKSLKNITDKELIEISESAHNLAKMASRRSLKFIIDVLDNKFVEFEIQRNINMLT
ncbi:MAG: hypothetical protein JETCAE03_31820 [Ignavibacteriaceae bacterium]|jgi:hypothetical protein|nr:MAG: hypothetical protein JETCAE03_31820 [Ignavibacteriaceae bacterium]